MKKNDLKDYGKVYKDIIKEQTETDGIGSHLIGRTLVRRYYAINPRNTTSPVTKTESKVVIKGITPRKNGPSINIQVEGDTSDDSWFSPDLEYFECEMQDTVNFQANYYSHDPDEENDAYDEIKVQVVNDFYGFMFEEDAPSFDECKQRAIDRINKERDKLKKKIEAFDKLWSISR